MTELQKEASRILRKYNLRPKHSLGQNFLINENILDSIVEGAKLEKTDTVVEVGPGLGFLSRKLAQQVDDLFLYEIDDNFVEILKSEFAGDTDVHIFNTSALEYAPPGNKYKVVANIPYYLTSAFIKRHLEEVENSPESMILMIQKEVADEIVAKSGKMSLLSISVHTFADPEILFYVPRENFYPSPNVDSAIIKIDVRGQKFDTDYLKLYFRIVKTGFSMRRKQIKNNFLTLFENADDMLDWLKEAYID